MSNHNSISITEHELTNRDLPAFSKILIDGEELILTHVERDSIHGVTRTYQRDPAAARRSLYREHYQPQAAAGNTGWAARELKRIIRDPWPNEA